MLYWGSDALTCRPMVCPREGRHVVCCAGVLITTGSGAGMAYSQQPLTI